MYYAAAAPREVSIGEIGVSEQILSLPVEDLSYICLYLDQVRSYFLVGFSGKDTELRISQQRCIYLTLKKKGVFLQERYPCETSKIQSQVKVMSLPMYVNFIVACRSLIFISQLFTVPKMLYAERLTHRLLQMQSDFPIMFFSKLEAGDGQDILKCAELFEVVHNDMDMFIFVKAHMSTLKVHYLLHSLIEE
jgi:hypothetical protein